MCNILYNNSDDNLYILIKQIGSGGYSTIWFAIELKSFLKNCKKNKPQIISGKALKIHKDDSYDEGLKETIISDILNYNDKHSEYINYPTSHFIFDKKYVIVVYELALGSLYDIIKKYNICVDKYKSFFNEMIKQMKSSLNYVHKCGYIHCDIKPENYLLCGVNDEQSNIIKAFSKINFNKLVEPLLNKLVDLNNKNKINDFVKIIYNCFDDDLTDLFDKFDVNWYEYDKDTDYDDFFHSEEDNDDDDEDEEEDDEDDEDEDLASVSTYNSRDDEYDEYLDKFHIDKILNMGNNDNLSKQDIKISCSSIDKYLKNPKILLSDFGLMEECGSKCKTIQTRYYRAPEVVYGLDYDTSCDIWSLGASIYEILSGEILINIEKHDNYKIYDNEIIYTQLLIEKLGDMNSIYSLLNSSPRKDYIIKNGKIKYCKEFNIKNWKNNVKNHYQHIENMLVINPCKRVL